MTQASGLLNIVMTMGHFEKLLPFDIIDMSLTWHLHGHVTATENQCISILLQKNVIFQIFKCCSMFRHSFDQNQIYIWNACLGLNHLDFIAFLWIFYHFMQIENTSLIENAYLEPFLTVWWRMFWQDVRLLSCPKFLWTQEIYQCSVFQGELYGTIILSILFLHDLYALSKSIFLRWFLSRSFKVGDSITKLLNQFDDWSMEIWVSILHNTTSAKWIMMMKIFWTP